MSIDILTVNRGIKNSCILSRRKSLMALYHWTQAIITFLLNNPLYSEFVECRYPSSVKISTCNFHSQCSLGAVSVQIGASGGTRELFSVNYVLHYFWYNPVQTRCSLGAYSVLLVEPESYFQSIRSSTVSGVFRRGRRGRRGEAGEVGRQARRGRRGRCRRGRCMSPISVGL